MTTCDDGLYWLALRMVPGLGTRTAWKLIDRFQSPAAVFRASRTELEAEGVSGSVAQSIASGCAFDDAIAQGEKAKTAGAVLLTLEDFPERLREIFDPPLVLYARGKVELLQDVLLGVVGTRRPTPYGLTIAERVAGDLARAGLVIVSGMARGIDTSAHKGALAAGGKTIAVLGCGCDLVYPAENRKLAAEIAEKGLLLSEFPMGAPAYPQNFPIRNRIISGMSAGVLVVEGAQYSGSSITARLALEQGREVFAVPGSIMSKMSWGPNLLIKQGAKLIQDWNDVVVELPPEDRVRLVDASQGRLFDETGGAPPASTATVATPISRGILSQLRPDTPMHIDTLLEALENYTSSETLEALFELEMAGVVRQLPGKNYVKVW